MCSLRLENSRVLVSSSFGDQFGRAFGTSQILQQRRVTVNCKLLASEGFSKLSERS